MSEARGHMRDDVVILAVAEHTTWLRHDVDLLDPCVHGIVSWLTANLNLAYI